jgi:hypothetical protein
MSGLLAASPQGIFYVACGALLLAVAVLALVLRPILALWALAGVFAAELASPVPLDTSLLRAGATHVYPADVLTVMMLIATVINLIRRPPPARIMLPLSAAAAVFAANLYRGAAEFGLRHAVNESREWFYFLATTAFVVVTGPWASRFWRPWFALAVGLVGLSWFGLARYGLHPVTSQIVVNGQLVDPRPLTAAGALALAFVLITMLGSRSISVRRKVVFGAVLLGTIVLVQQRTVWVVLAVVFLIWAAASLHRYSTGRHRRLAAGGVAALGGAALVLVSGLATGSVFGRSLAETTARNSTLQWRLIGWADLLHSLHSPAAFAFGLPFGSGYRRTVLGAVTNVEPHSLYVAALLRLGLAGVLALGLLYWHAWQQRRQAATELGVSPLTIALVLVALLVFSITYEPGFFASAVVAGLLAWQRQPGPQVTAEAEARPVIPLLDGGP